MRALYGIQLSLESSNPDHLTLNCRVDRRLRSPPVLASTVDLLLHSVADSLMGRHERLVQLLALEVKATGRGYHAQDHEGVPYEGNRRASIEEVRELYEAQEVEGLCGGLVIEEVTDRRERTDVRHVQPGHGRGHVVGSILQRRGLVRRGKHDSKMSLC